MASFSTMPAAISYITDALQVAATACHLVLELGGPDADVADMHKALTSLAETIDSAAQKAGKNPTCLQNLSDTFQRVDKDCKKTLDTLELYFEQKLDEAIQDERAATARCLRICTAAKNLVQSLQQQQQSTSAPESGRAGLQNYYEVQISTSKTSYENQSLNGDAPNRLQEPLDGLAMNNESPQRRLGSGPYIHKFGDIMARQNCSCVVVMGFKVVTTVKFGKNTKQLVGSMNDEALQKAIEVHYRAPSEVAQSTCTIQSSCSAATLTRLLTAQSIASTCKATENRREESVHPFGEELRRLRLEHLDATSAPRDSCQKFA